MFYTGEILNFFLGYYVWCISSFIRVLRFDNVKCGNGNKKYDIYWGSILFLLFILCVFNNLLHNFWKLSIFFTAPITFSLFCSLNVIFIRCLIRYTFILLCRSLFIYTHTQLFRVFHFLFPNFYPTETGFQKQVQLWQTPSSSISFALGRLCILADQIAAV